MASQEEEQARKEASNENKYMWIAVGVIVVIILGGMGINMLVHHESSADTIETSSPK